MRSLLAFGALAMFAAPLGALAAGEAPAKIMRSLVYQVTYSAHSSHERKTSGLDSGYGGAESTAHGGVSGGSATAGVGLDGADTGLLTIDVIAATADGGLVVDASYSGRLSSQPKLRVALFADGRLSADPKVTLGTAALHILPLLARGFVANRDVSPGSSWTIAAPPPARGSTTYRVSSLDGEQATIALDGSLSVPGVTGFEETDRGTTKYATNLLSPVSYDINARIRRQLAIDESVTTEAHLTATLVSDTFAKK